MMSKIYTELSFVLFEDPVRNGRKFVFFYDLPPSRGAIKPPPPSTHHPPTHRPTHHSSTYRLIHNGSTQQCSSTHHSSASGTRGAGWDGDFHFLTIITMGARGAGFGGDFHLLIILCLPGGERNPSRGEPFRAPRSPSWEPSVVMSPETPSADV